MTSRVHHSHAGTHESRARGIQSPASGAYSHELSSAGLSPGPAGARERPRFPPRTLNPTRLPEHRCRIGLPSREQRLVIGSLAMFPPAKRVPHSLNINRSHLRRASVLAANRQRSI